MKRVRERERGEGKGGQKSRKCGKSRERLEGKEQVRGGKGKDGEGKEGGRWH